MGWPTFWAIFSQTHLVTLILSCHDNIVYINKWLNIDFYHLRQRRSLAARSLTATGIESPPKWDDSADGKLARLRL
jgi:hypothetical protein